MIPLRSTDRVYSRTTVTISLIAVNLVIFLYQAALDPYALDAFVTRWGIVPDQLRLVTLFTSMFLHGGWMHVLGNMLFLWVFGDNVEDILGHGKYLLFYLVCGVTAGLAQVVIDPYSRVPMVGASGAIAGVMGAYLVKFPRSEVKMLAWFILIFTFDVPAWVMLIYWFGLQLLGGVDTVGEASQGGTAFFAHIGGFLAGIVLIQVMGTRQRYWRRKDLVW
jgi:membrane associated rhomboid family serine protease